MSSKKSSRKFFAVTSLGKDRWYWVVWPSLETMQENGSGQPVADGYEPTKAEAADRALEIAGLYGEWVAAKYAKAQHRQLKRREKQGGQSSAAPAVQEFLYRDIQNPESEEWYSVSHRITHKTNKYVYVEKEPYDPDRLTGSWLDQDVPTFRLSREMLEAEGYALTPVMEIDDPMFFTTPYQDRLIQFSDEAPASLELLNLTFPCTIAEVKAAYRQRAKQAHPDQGGSHDEFLALQAAYEQALRMCRYTS